MVPYSVSQATSTLAGHRLGEGDFVRARGIVQIGILVDFAYGAVAGLILVTVLRAVCVCVSMHELFSSGVKCIK